MLKSPQPPSYCNLDFLHVTDVVKDIFDMPTSSYISSAIIAVGPSIEAMENQEAVKL
jgi:hypothetical protein